MSKPNVFPKSGIRFIFYCLAICAYCFIFGEAFCDAEEWPSEGIDGARETLQNFEESNNSSAPNDISDDKGDQRIMNGEYTSDASSVMNNDAGNSRYSPVDNTWIFAEDALYTTRRNLAFTVDSEAIYNDNILESRDDVKSDYITRITPKARYVFKPKIEPSRTKILSSFGLGLSGEFMRYWQNKEFNKSETYTSGDMLLSAESRFFDRLTVHGRVTKRQDFASNLYSDVRENSSPNDRMRRVDFWTVDYGANYLIGTARSRWIPGYSHSETIYVSSQDEDRDQMNDKIFLNHETDIMKGLKFLINTAISFVRGNKSADVNNSNNNQSKQISASTGISGEIAPKTTATVTGGYSMWDRDTGTTTGDVIWSFDLGYKINKRCKVTGGFSRTIQETSSALGNTEDRPYSLTDRNSNLDIASYYSKVSRIYCEMEYNPAISKNLTMEGHASKNFTEYSSSYTDESYNFGASARYKMLLNMVFSVGYNYYDHLPSSNRGGYKNNIVSVKLRLEF
ncbi:hypothetical protein OMAG_000729 [Candidatus Omnitrophus magneticus]|uniref:Uncharacterized protein n=1 Tax=Candidatus Omnitrophus magneticus TaxID=1609969 RepID=A0A0F0CTQ3_9BACT|nr:hypothetical protein OMAG_000729 [Candidatus Omnitrophus magneticus]